MGRVTVDEILKADEGTVTTPNTTLASWTTQSTDVDATNVAQEGIEQRNLAANAVNDDTTGATQIFSSDSSGTATVGNTPTAWTVGAGVAVRIGAFEYNSAADPDLIVRCLFEAQAEGADYFRYALYRSTTGVAGAYSVVTKTTRGQLMPGVAAAAALWYPLGVYMRETAAISSTNIWYHLYVWSDGATALTVRNIEFYAERFKV